MFGKIFVAASVAMLTLAGAAMAQSPTQIGVYDKWGAYSYKTSDNSVCYVLSMPIKMEPTTVNHGDNYFLVSQRAGKAGSFEPQFMAGYMLSSAKVTVSVDDKNFELFTKNQSAWVADPSLESQLVAAMRAGNNMTVKATSQRGTRTSYTFSLQGITAAMKAAQNRCGG